ncbi:glycosyltransferase family 2 protein [Sporobacter termitidis]|uniref:glycosyltransferase family 2 protein n=1 Tax=Sporobacter termitidis TaxID=44749 RepID=UPI000932807A|nr:glycosyltransferase family 2 protein [Sporobacter termitidis]
MNNTLYIVVPCYNEEEVLRETASRLRGKMRALISAGKISGGSRVLFVNDGSRDKTWEMIRALSAEDALFTGVALSRNRGHQNALLAGLMTARGRADMVVSMDADLQDDVDAVDRMVDEYLSGADVVYGVRNKREKDAFLKRFTAEGYYKLLDAMGVEVVFNHADYRLLSARALDALSQYGERNMFIRGIIPMLGYKTATVTYERGERFAGESKYPLKKMLALASDGVYSLSMKPLRFITGLGVTLLVLAAALLIYAIVRLCMGYTILDWKIVTISVWGVGGLILLALGIIGEYVGRAYMELKGRPRYHIGETVGLDRKL